MQGPWGQAAHRDVRLVANLPVSPCFLPHSDRLQELSAAMHGPKCSRPLANAELHSIALHSARQPAHLRGARLVNRFTEVSGPNINT